MFVKKSVLTFGGASLIKGLISTPTRRGLTFVRAKVSKTRSRGTDSPLTNPFLSPCCAGYERRFSTKKPSVLHADGLNKVSQMHLPPPNLPRFGGGERPPFLCKTPAPLTITMGQRPIFRPIIVLTALRCPKKSSHCSFARFFRPLRILRLASSATGGARLRIPNHRDPPPPQALTPRECYPRALIISPSEPLSRLGKGGGGKGQMRLRLPWERFCAQYGLVLDCRQKSIRIQHSQRQGSWGRAPSVFWFLLHE